MINKTKRLLHSYAKARNILAVTLTATLSGALVEKADAERPPSNWRQRGWTEGFNGGFNTKHWVKSTQRFSAVANGRGVGYFTWMVDHANVGGRNCLRIKSNSYGTIDKGGAVDNTPGYGGHQLKYGWFEAATKISALNEWFWPTWWTITPGGNPKDELDIMEYSWGNFGVKHWRHTNGNKPNGFVKRDWYKGNSYIKSNLLDKFSLWSAKSTYNGGVKFFKDNGQIASGNRRVNYGMHMRLSSSPNRRRAGTPKNVTFPHFYVDYVRVWTPN